jgi:TATA-binding protein-associated factor Taf7
MENQAEEYIKALQTTIAHKQIELEGLSGWHPLQRRRLKHEIKTLETWLEPLLKQAQGIRQ